MKFSHTTVECFDYWPSGLDKMLTEIYGCMILTDMLSMSLGEPESEALVCKGVLIIKEQHVHYIPVMFDTQSLFPGVEVNSC